MNKVVRNLVATGVIATSVITAGQFMGSQTIDKAQEHIVKSYDLLTQYDAKKSELESKIQELTTQLEDANVDKESLQTQIDSLTSEKAILEAEIERLNAIIENNGGLEAELTEANRQIDIANNKVKELENVLADKDLSQFNPNEGNEQAVISDVSALLEEGSSQPKVFFTVNEDINIAKLGGRITISANNADGVNLGYWSSTALGGKTVEDYFVSECLTHGTSCDTTENLHPGKYKVLLQRVPGEAVTDIRFAYTNSSDSSQNMSVNVKLAK